MRVHERVCETNDQFSIVDFSLKAKSRHCKHNDYAYFFARNDLSIWSNIRDGNSLLVKYAEDDGDQVESVTTLRCGLPRFFNLTADAVHPDRSANLHSNEELAYYQYETLAQVRRAIMEGA